MVYVSFGEVRKNTGALHAAKISTSAGVLNTQLQNIDINLNQSIQANKGVDTYDLEKAAYDSAQYYSGIYANEPTLQAKILPYMNKYTQNMTKVQYGAPNAMEKSQIMGKMFSDIEGAMGPDNYINPDDAKVALNNWKKSGPASDYNLDTFLSKFGRFLNYKTDYPGIRSAKKSSNNWLLDTIKNYLGL